MTEVWNCGGGTQSVAIAALIIQGKLPKPEIAVIADTGRETQSTWDYYESILYPNLLAIGVTLQRISKKQYATCDLWSTNGRQIEIPGFTFQTGEKGKLINFCTTEWKIRVIARFLRELGVSKYRRWLGFSLEESRRWVKHLESSEIRLPLITDVPMRRRDCVSLIRKMGWPTAPRSRCWMCPNQSDDEWRQLSSEEFTKAVKLESEIREKDPFFFLHESGVTLDRVDWSRKQLEFAGECSSGECFL
jgi:hypothetical protein